MNFKLFLLVFLVSLPQFFLAQASEVTISMEGSVNNFETKDKLFGTTIYLMQEGRTISKSITDNYGNYSISGKVDINEAVDLMVSKPGYVSKKVLFDLVTLKINKKRATETTLELLEELVIELYELKQGADLSFAKIGYAEKFIWDQPAFIVRPDEKQKSDLDKKVKEAYDKAAKTAVTSKYDIKANQAIAKKDYQKAKKYYDSALVVNPMDSVLLKKRSAIEKTITDENTEAQKKKDYDAAKTAGDEAFKKSNWATAESKYKEALSFIQKDPYATSQLQKIATEKLKEQDNIKNKANYDKAIAEAASFVTAKKYNEAISKYNAALTYQPNQKTFIDGEIAKLKGNLSDASLEELVKKELKGATDLATKAKYDDALKAFRATEPTIVKFSSQALIDKYSKEVQDGIQKVQDKKNSEDQAYKDQLAKAQENYAKGRSFYNVAKNILNSDPMKSKVNEPEVVELNEKITKMEAYYLEKEVAYKSVAANKNDEAIEKLTRSSKNYVIAKKIAPQNEITQLQKSIDSLKQLVKQANVSTTNTANSTSSAVATSTKLNAPGEIVANKDAVSAYNDMNETTAYRKASPLKQQESVKDSYDYGNYYNQTVIAARQEGEKIRAYNNASVTEMVRRDVQKEAVELQYDMEDKKLLTEVTIEKQQADAKASQEKISQIIDKWKDNSDFSSEKYQKELQEQHTAQISTIDRNKSQSELKSRSLVSDNNKRQYEQQSKIEKINYANYKQDSASRAEQEMRGYQIQKKADAKIVLGKNANNLVDENGIAFEKNKMTERVYKTKNSEGFVISVILRRVVVDKNGYGVVYEQITNESGTNYFTRNGSPVPESVWFNESSGETVIER